MSRHAFLDVAIVKPVRAKEIGLSIRHAGVMRVGAGDDSHLIGIVAARLLHRDTVLVGLAHETAGDRGNLSLRIAKQIVEQLVIRELVIGREQRMRLRLTLDLLDLGQPLIAIPGCGPGSIDWTPLLVYVDREHVAVREVRVVRDGKQLVAGLSLPVHPVP